MSDSTENERAWAALKELPPKEEIKTLINLLRARADVEEAEGLTTINFQTLRKAADVLETIARVITPL